MNLDIKPVDAQRSVEYTTIPKLPFSMYINAAKGGGKSTLILNLLLNPSFVNKKFNRIIWISPTAAFDEKVHKALDAKDITTPNTALIKLIKKLKQKEILDIDLTNKEPLESLESEDRVEFYDKFETDIISEVVKINSKIAKNYGKQFADKTLIIIDDSIESKVFASTLFKNLMFKSRHYNVSIIITSQSYFLLPKSIRLNMTYTILFETGSKKEIDQIYEEHNAGLKPRQFYQLVSDVFSVPYNFLVINYNNPKKLRFHDQFKKFIDTSKYLT